MSRVFVIHQPVLRDHSSGNLRPQFDLSPALAFGQVVEVLPPGNVSQDARQLQASIARRLNEEGYAEGDYILALGDPVAMAAGVLVASKMSETVRLLKWDRRSGAYLPCELRAQ